jgi:hypothetical protein
VEEEIQKHFNQVNVNHEVSVPSEDAAMDGLGNSQKFGAQRALFNPQLVT